MNAMEPFGGWPWALAPAVIDHIAERLDLDVLYAEIARRHEIFRPASRRSGWSRDE